MGITSAKNKNSELSFIALAGFSALLKTTPRFAIGVFVSQEP
jgi:hypothetical protein